MDLEAMSVPDPVETAWKIHTALSDWTGKVDAKASFALTIESAALAVIVGLSGADHRFGNLRGFWQNAPFWGGVFLLGLSALAAVSVVAPRIRANSVEPEWADNFIYFGHLKFWQPDQLEQALKDTDPLPALSRQLVVMSRIAWTKHRRVQVSLWLAIAGAALVGVAGMISGW
jgi:hypothetical protein